jgi:hypothetical protein
MLVDRDAAGRPSVEQDRGRAVGALGISSITARFRGGQALRLTGVPLDRIDGTAGVPVSGSIDVDERHVALFDCLIV